MTFAFWKRKPKVPMSFAGTVEETEALMQAYHLEELEKLIKDVMRATEQASDNFREEITR